VHQVVVQGHRVARHIAAHRDLHHRVARHIAVHRDLHHQAVRHIAVHQDLHHRAVQVVLVQDLQVDVSIGNIQSPYIKGYMGSS
jgi:hypothetical protein